MFLCAILWFFGAIFIATTTSGYIFSNHVEALQCYYCSAQNVLARCQGPPVDKSGPCDGFCLKISVGMVDDGTDETVQYRTCVPANSLMLKLDSGVGDGLVAGENGSTDFTLHLVSGRCFIGPNAVERVLFSLVGGRRTNSQYNVVTPPPLHAKDSMAASDIDALRRQLILGDDSNAPPNRHAGAITYMCGCDNADLCNAASAYRRTSKLLLLLAASKILLLLLLAYAFY